MLTIIKTSTNFSVRGGHWYRVTKHYNVNNGVRTPESSIWTAVEASSVPDEVIYRAIRAWWDSLRVEQRAACNNNFGLFVIKKRYSYA
jgi:hypothetical protein